MVNWVDCLIDKHSSVQRANMQVAVIVLKAREQDSGALAIRVNQNLHKLYITI